MTNEKYYELLKNGYMTTILEMFTTSDRVMINLVKLANYTLEEAETAYKKYLEVDLKFKEILIENKKEELETSFEMTEYAEEARKYIRESLGINIVEPKNLREAFGLVDCVIHTAAKNGLNVPMPSNFLFAKPISENIIKLRRQALKEWFEEAHGMYRCEY